MRDCRHVSRMKNPRCSPYGIVLASQHLHDGSHMSLTSVPKGLRPSLASVDTMSTHGAMFKYADKTIIS